MWHADSYNEAQTASMRDWNFDEKLEFKAYLANRLMCWPVVQLPYKLSFELDYVFPKYKMLIMMHPKIHLLPIEKRPTAKCKIIGRIMRKEGWLVLDTDWNEYSNFSTSEERDEHYRSWLAAHRDKQREAGVVSSEHLYP